MVQKNNAILTITPRHRHRIQVQRERNGIEIVDGTTRVQPQNVPTKKIRTVKLRRAAAVKFLKFLMCISTSWLTGGGLVSCPVADMSKAFMRNDKYVDEQSTHRLLYCVLGV